MDQKKLNKLVNKNKYQVFLFTSSVPFPLNFAVHGWFVINIKGEVQRWEFGRFRGSPHKNNIGILKDFFKPTEGMNKYFWKSYPRFDSKLIHFIEGDNKSVAKKIALFIEKKSNSYPLKNIYSLKGPNSNSYMQWVLNKFPKSGFKLPINAFGKRFKFKNKI